MAQFVSLSTSFVLGIMLLSFAGTTVIDEVVVTTGGTGVPPSPPALFAIMIWIGAVYEHKEQTKKSRLDRYEDFSCEINIRLLSPLGRRAHNLFTFTQELGEKVREDYLS
jgi:hypothetical protein